ncbi:phosphoribosylformylglycinamidine synthase II [Candidatus Desantisbacteria bacterium CG2_30_40_21]|uniref:Phosphoribosylformylglycinamidine synthase subunit PurL n=3 Tax=unclassified Candidatus Desantisiibacteriota TaxID=3106372 RepID=A0A2M7JDR5_9BACT|nr:MAG: phosphoribosylformylglycinamidine synthase II [Candidatus Desantisbacteria bacterium CG2_30_40_21]PIX17549.1 MAG: phosphoribosylformylglycinamidine synthase subunit PurL [Candidatus Desantisbacteria bacterium CG_4_8_14_3_um_filter_40_12]PIY19054.1 MAG: phosphoribosylformylglycinamidine synthase subunit PurL [Candidatus Desantisbacteria bacterium CG_4_10_14_3_um_filter_40_18]
MEITKQLIAEHGLSEKEYEKILNILKRTPTLTELGIFSVMWSEHCSYKSSRSTLSMLPTKSEKVLVGPGENAGVMDIGDGIWIAFKIESHNHPSAVEPYQGAATGVGGILRDIFTMGARPIAILDSLRFGEMDSAQNKRLLRGVVSGIAGYGNCMGIPTIGGEVCLEPAYERNPLVNVMSLGVITNGTITKGAAYGEGNPIIYIGSATGKDGIKGASFASRELTESSYEDRPAVQVGDPFMEKLLLEACLELVQEDYLLGMQDMGAAGLTCSTCEMAARGAVGMEIDLSLVPRRAKDMSAYELMLSESQERMLICVKKGYEDEVEKIFKKWDLHSVVIGYVTNDGLLRVRDGETIVAEIPAKTLADDAPLYHHPEKEPEYLKEMRTEINPVPTTTLTFNEILLSLLASPAIASKAWIYEQYDHMVRTNTLICPGKGDAGVVRLKGTKKAIAMSTDGNGRYCYLDPYAGGMLAVAEAARNVVCVGATPLAITNCLNFGSPMDPEVMWQFRRVVEGITAACQALGVPVTGGNVSFYNESEDGPIYPTPVIGMVGIIQDASVVTDMGFKDEGDVVVLLGLSQDEIGGSEYLKVIHRTVKGSPPVIDIKMEVRVQQAVLRAFEAGLIKSAHDCAEGGLAVTLAECCLQGKIGARIESKLSIPITSLLFGESQSRIVVSVAKDNLSQLMQIIMQADIPYEVLGVVEGEALIINDLIRLSLEEMEANYQWQN